jgi:hypothetical protein
VLNTLSLSYAIFHVDGWETICLYSISPATKNFERFFFLDNLRLRNPWKQTRKIQKKRNKKKKRRERKKKKRKKKSR